MIDIKPSLMQAATVIEFHAKISRYVVNRSSPIEQFTTRGFWIRTKPLIMLAVLRRSV